jgi:hypothetical protein
MIQAQIAGVIVGSASCGKAAHTLPAPWIRLGGTKMRSSERSSPRRQPLRVVRAISVQPLVRNWEHPDAMFSKCQTNNDKKMGEGGKLSSNHFPPSITSDYQHLHGIPRDANFSESVSDLLIAGMS